MSGVEDERNAMSDGDSLELRDRSRAPPKLDGEDGARSSVDERSGVKRVEMMCRRIDVAENDLQPLPMHGVSGRNERERRENHSSAYIASSKEKLERERPVGRGDAVLDADELGDSLLQFAYHRAVV